MIMIMIMMMMMMMMMMIEMVKVKVMLTTCSIEAGMPGRPIKEERFAFTFNRLVTKMS